MSDHEHEDRIFLHGLRTECIIGFIDWERQMPQTLLIDLEFRCDAAHAAATDRVTDTIDYKRIAKRVLAWAQGSGISLCSRPSPTAWRWCCSRSSRCIG